MRASEVALAVGFALACLIAGLAISHLRASVRRQRLLFESLPQMGVVVFDRDLRVRFAAGPVVRQVGWQPLAVEGKSLLELFPPAHAQALETNFRAALRGETRSFEYHPPLSGQDYWMRVVPITDERGTVVRGMSVALDISDRDQITRELGGRVKDVDAVAAATRALARSVDAATARGAICEAARELAEAPVAALFELGPDGSGLRATAVSGAELAGFDLSVDSESGAALAFTRAEEIFVGEGASPAEADREFMLRAGVSSVLWHPVVRDRAAIGVLAIAWREPVRGVSLRLSAMIDFLCAEAAVAIGRADMLHRLRHMARTDELTGLPNRRYWEQQLPRELARSARERRPLCVAMLDLDRFKDYNDRRGHQAGDRLLRDAAASWSMALRPYDVLARHGGEEFALMLPGCATEHGVSLVERLRSLTPQGESCSAGLAEWRPGESAESLLGRADAALYSAKRAGRDRVVVAPDGSQGAAAEA